MTTTPKHMAIAEAILRADHVRALEATEHLDLEPYDREQVRNALRCSCAAEPDSHHRRIGEAAVKARDAAKARRVVDLDAMDAAMRRAMSIMTRALTLIEHDHTCDAAAEASAAMQFAEEALRKRSVVTLAAGEALRSRPANTPATCVCCSVVVEPDPDPTLCEDCEPTYAAEAGGHCSWHDPSRPRPAPCLDPNKMNGAADQQWDDL